jgi:hypothetical protein
MRAAARYPIQSTLLLVIFRRRASQNGQLEKWHANSLSASVDTRTPATNRDRSKIPNNPNRLRLWHSRNETGRPLFFLIRLGSHTFLLLHWTQPQRESERTNERELSPSSERRSDVCHSTSACSL